MTQRVAYQPPTQTLEHVLGSDPAVVRGFARAADDKLANGSISLAEREKLISRGVRLGLKRFDANLILAAMEQRRREHPPIRMACSTFALNPDLHSPRLPRWLGWMTVLTLQSGIVAGLIWLVK